MLSHGARLRASEVRQIIKSGKSLRSAAAPHVSLKYMQSPTFRAAIVVSKSIARTATERNRLRRAAYNALRELAPSFHAQAVLFIQKRPSSPLAPTLRTEVQSLIGSL
ncbi:ribonuclease P protein component [Candidatus Parcubacteria bacterium]|nr:ribonuclease P protein component [Candidatus Parcubacteria bacterium]